MEVTLLFFGPLADAAEMRTRRLAISGQTLAKAVFDEIRAEFPDIGVGLKFAVNQQYSVGAEILKDGDEIAVIPPVSGG